MSNKNCNGNGKGILGLLAVAGAAVLVKKAVDKKRRVKGILRSYGIEDCRPVAIADKIRGMEQAKYDEMKAEIGDQMCCKKPSCCKA